MDEVDWGGRFLSCEDAEILYDTFSTILSDLSNIIFPRKRSLGKENWITTGIKISCRKLFDDKLLGLVSEEHYRNYCNILKSVITAAKQRINVECISNAKNKNKATWNLIKKYSGKQPASNQNMFENFQNVDKKSLVYFNKFYVRCEKDNNAESEVYPIQEDHHASIFLEPTDEREVHQIIKSLGNTNAVGRDEIIIKCLEHIPHIITALLCHQLDALH
ncbi:hypothetical protein HHI36_012578 [Cryptolaemus montrouzieri]|uniref:Uncharacterized protein n=1 Tax=Cryptolaemus montrouzieri TaxID=559131 RepID=A0ABD2NEP5_9CUCU